MILFKFVSKLLRVSTFPILWGLVNRGQTVFLPFCKFQRVLCQIMQMYSKFHSDHCVLLSAMSLVPHSKVARVR